ncbi:hypothetical protein I4U23_022650 [Adineta vaga]|nr:hypothetical protein I4U23_022650 [Adineta vaga]
MFIFGFWTVKNIRRIRRPVRYSGTTNLNVAVIGRPQILQSKDQQLIRILLVELITYILCKCPITTCYIYLEITRHTEKSTEQELIEQCILSLTIFVYFIENSISCYANILVSKTFRSELKRILFNVRQVCRSSHY